MGPLPLVTSPRLLRWLWWVLVGAAGAVFVGAAARGQWLALALSGVALAELIREARVRRRTHADRGHGEAG